MPETNNNSFVVAIPNSIVWAFNPNYIDVTAPAGSIITYVEVIVGNNPAIKVNLYNGHAKAYISRLLQLCFAQPKTERVKTVNIQVWTPEIYTPTDDHDSGIIYEDEVIEAEKIGEANPTVVWGGINLGERAFNYGVYSYEQGRGWLTSHIQCFVNFPFNLELLVANNSSLHRRTNRTGYTQKAVYTQDQLVTLAKANILENLSNGTVVYRQELNNINEGGTFDTSFDYTFHTPSDTTVITYIHLRPEKEGFYLRWVNHFGFIQYYLFDKGNRTTKTKRIALMPEDTQMDGMYFGNSARSIGINSERSIKMCAMNLNRDTLTYVQDIISSPFIDLYIGLDKHGHEIWMPVRIADNSYTVKMLHNYLSDFEITIELPNHVTQTI